MKKKRVRDKFLEELRRVPIISVACQNCGVSRNTVYRWRNEDPIFLKSMDTALVEGESSVHDLAESKLVGLINKSNLQAIRFWLTSRNSKYKTPSRMAIRADVIEEEIERREQEKNDQTIKALGLTDKDFEEENRIATSKKISDYLSSL